MIVVVVPSRSFAEAWAIVGDGVVGVCVGQVEMNMNTYQMNQSPCDSMKGRGSPVGLVEWTYKFDGGFSGIPVNVNGPVKNRGSNSVGTAIVVRL